MSEVIITDVEEIQNCPVCTGELMGATIAGTPIKVCRVQRNHGFFMVKYASDNDWFIEFIPSAP